jgi:hypothetical protein
MWSVLLVEKTTNLQKVSLSQKYVSGTVLTMSGNWPTLMEIGTDGTGRYKSTYIVPYMIFTVPDALGGKFNILILY